MENKNDKNSMFNLIKTLTIIGIISGLALSFVFQWTQPHIAEHERQALEKSIYTVLPDAEEYQEVEKNGLIFYEGFDQHGSQVGVAYKSTGNGFQGEIVVMVGTDPQQEKILAISILQHQETPGLGARITEERFKNNFSDKPFGDYEVVTGSTEEPYEVEAISGATISVENVVQIVERAVKIISEEYGSGV